MGNLVQQATMAPPKRTTLTFLALSFGLGGSPAGAQKIYWTDTVRGIQRANLDGSDVETLVPKVLDNPEAITLDLVAERMYWSDFGASELGPTSKIQRANLNGSDIENLVTSGLDAVSGIVLDLEGGKMYWTDGRTNKLPYQPPNHVRRANLDGSGVEELVAFELDDPRGIALDLIAGKMYWAHELYASGAGIRRANLDGTTVEDLVTDLSSPYGIALDLRSVEQPIPTVSDWGTAVMALLVLTAGTLVLARRRPAHI